MAGKRRRKKKPIFLFILISVLAIELLIAIGLLKISLLLDHSHLGVYASPAIASIAGGFLYWWLAEKKDYMIVNQSLQPNAEADD